MTQKVKTPKRGRPAADPKNPRNQRVVVFFSEAELALLSADQNDKESLGAVAYRWLKPTLRRRLKRGADSDARGIT